MKTLINFILAVMWICGIVIVKGFWSTLFAVIIPPYSWYLVVEHFLIKYNLL